MIWPVCVPDYIFTCEDLTCAVSQTVSWLWQSFRQSFTIDVVSIKFHLNWIWKVNFGTRPSSLSNSTVSLSYPEFNSRWSTRETVAWRPKLKNWGFGHYGQFTIPLTSSQIRPEVAKRTSSRCWVSEITWLFSWAHKHLLYTQIDDLLHSYFVNKHFKSRKKSILLSFDIRGENSSVMGFSSKG